MPPATRNRKKVAAGLTSGSSMLASSSTDDIASSSSHQPFKLREYQQQGIKKCLDGFNSGLTRIGVSAPTGSGKTAMFAYLIPRVLEEDVQGPWKGNSRVLIIVDGVTLANQVRDYIKQHCHNLGQVGMEQGGARVSPFDKIIVATWQSLITPARILRFKPSDFQLVIADEAHHCGANSYLSVLHYFHQDVTLTAPAKLLASSIEHGHRVPIVGFSGTFSREDHRKLGWVFQEVVYHLSVDELIRQKHLCEPKWISLSHKVWELSAAIKESDPQAGVDAAGVRHEIKRELEVVDGDINTQQINATDQHIAVPKSIAKMAKMTAFNDLVVDMYLEKATLVFGSNLALVADLKERFIAKGIVTASITSKMPDFKREQVLSDFKDGKIAVLVNCQLMAEGTDVPMIDCIIIAKPVNSINLWSQMIGRGLRTSVSTGKTNCLVLSFFDGYTRLNLGVKPKLSND